MSQQVLQSRLSRITLIIGIGWTLFWLASALRWKGSGVEEACKDEGGLAEQFLCSRDLSDFWVMSDWLFYGAMVIGVPIAVAAAIKIGRWIKAGKP